MTRPWAVGYAVAFGVVALTTGLIALLIGGAHTRIANISMLYLVGILLTAVAFGRGPAIAASVAAFLAFDWFFVAPRHTLTIADPAEYVSLLLFLITAAVTGSLASSQRARARDAAAREREAIVLSDVVQLLAAPELDRAFHAAAARLRDELRLGAVAIRVHASDLVPDVLVGSPEALDLLRASGERELFGARAPSAAGRGGPGRWIRVMPPYRAGRSASDRIRVVPASSGERRVATLQLVAQPDARLSRADERLLAAIAAQIAAAVERAELRRSATEAEVLRRTDEVRSALLDAVSHDLRTPLASIVAAAGSLQQQDVSWSDTDRADLAGAIEQEARRLDRLVGNLLDLSRIEGGSLVPQKGWYDVGTLVDEVLGRLREATKAHRVVARVPPDLPPVQLDYVEIAQVLTNLIENATKFAPPGSEIEIGAGADDGRVRFEVSDRGPGIPERERARLFTPFARLERDARTPGSGLGLAIARRFIEAHGGRIGVEPREGGGARFYFTLPT